MCDELVIVDTSVKSFKTTETQKKNDVAFECNFCDFKSSRKSGLTVHIGRKHNHKFPQLDGNTSTDCVDDEDDILYISTENYWKRGFLSSVYQSYINALQLVEESDLDEKEKKIEKDEILCARKKALGDGYLYYPPWRK